MKKKLCIVFYILILIIANINFAFADDFGLYSDLGNNPLAGSVNIILGVIKWGGVAILIAMIIYKGIKFMTVAPEGKAQIKNELIMLVIGAFILFSVVSLVDWVYTLISNSNINDIKI